MRTAPHPITDPYHLLPRVFLPTSHPLTSHKQQLDPLHTHTYWFPSPSFQILEHFISGTLPFTSYPFKRNICHNSHKSKGNFGEHFFDARLNLKPMATTMTMVMLKRIQEIQQKFYFLIICYNTAVIILFTPKTYVNTLPPPFPTDSQYKPPTQIRHTNFSSPSWNTTSAPPP